MLLPGHPPLPPYSHCGPLISPGLLLQLPEPLSFLEEGGLYPDLLPHTARSEPHRHLLGFDVPWNPLGWAGLSWACFCLVRGCPFAGSRHRHFPGSAPPQLRLSLWNLCPMPRAHLCFLKSLLSGGAPAQQAPLSCCQCPLGFWVCASMTPTQRSTDAPHLRSLSASPLLTVGLLAALLAVL